MEQQRKHAYRYLLYQATLDIRPLAWLRWDWYRFWNPLHRRREWRRIRCAGAIADWLHNLALFSALDFGRFDEEWFWRDFEKLRASYPEFGLERYRDLFDRRAEPQPQEMG